MTFPIAIPEHIQQAIDMPALIDRMAKTDWYYDYSDDPVVWGAGCVERLATERALQQLAATEGGMDIARALWENFVPPYSVRLPDWMKTTDHHLSTYQPSVMNQKNIEFLSNQLKYTGFGEEHINELVSKMEKGAPEFALYHQQKYGKDDIVATLQFGKPENGEIYFFNRYNIILNNENLKQPIKQTFYIHGKEDNVTLKEGYNLLCGRAVQKELTNKEGQKYNAWIQLDFKNTDKHGNFEVKKFHENYGFDLEKVLAKHGIAATNETDKASLLESLQRGNRQSATLEVAGQSKIVFIEAAPQYKSLNFYNGEGKRMDMQKVLGQGVGQTQGVAAAQKQDNGMAAGSQQMPPQNGVSGLQNGQQQNGIRESTGQQNGQASPRESSSQQKEAKPSAAADDGEGPPKNKQERKQRRGQRLS